MKIRIALLIFLLGDCFLITSTYAQEISATRVKEKTEKSARFLQKEGEAGLAAISDPESEWAKEPYLFVYDLDGNIIAHPNNKLIGKKFLGIKDLKGKMFPAEFVMVAKSDKGKGWVTALSTQPRRRNEPNHTGQNLEPADIRSRHHHILDSDQSVFSERVVGYSQPEQPGQ
jgi:hypothetical protein